MFLDKKFYCLYSNFLIGGDIYEPGIGLNYFYIFVSFIHPVIYSSSYKLEKFIRLFVELII